jgi:hypothetical protein
MTKVEAIVIRERVETVIDAVEHETGHVGVRRSATDASAASRTSTADVSSSRGSCRKRT